MNHKEILLRAEDVRVTFDAGRRRVVRAVDGVDLVLHAGETLGLVGESGCGKSTLGRALLRLEPLAGGRLWAFGAEVGQARGRALLPLRQRAAMVFQDPQGSLNPRQTIGWSVAEPLVVHRRGDAKARAERVQALLARVGLDPALAERRPQGLSGGQLQRVGIARALALDPSVVVADEALSALDVSVQAGIVNLMLDLQAERGLAWLFVAHDLEIVRRVSHRVAVMYLGRIVESGPAATLFAAPSHPYTQALLAAAPRPDPSRRSQPAPLAGEPPSPLDPPSGCAFHPRCPLADAHCAAVRPALRALPDGRQVACHHAETPAVAPPRREGDGAVDPRSTLG
jgi:oligopeptide/dipeptide ABC transporter ATP-binding protein